MDSIVARGAKVAKGVEARLRGLQGVFKTLSEQHGEVTALLKRVRRDPAKRTELWPKIRMELLSHERGELREVFPVLREYPETRVLADRHDAEASQMTALIDRIHATAMSSDEWTRQFDQLIELVERHVNEEQNEFFPRAQQVIGVDRAKQIDPLFLTAKQHALATL
jgi:iron-sulfur cluster repair protein YtfE (RIC family)